MLTAHEPFKSVDYTIRSGRDMQTNQVATRSAKREYLWEIPTTAKKYERT